MHNKISDALRGNSLIGLWILAMALLVLSTIVNLLIVARGFPHVREVIMGNLYPRQTVYADGCEIIHIPTLQSDMYLFQGSTAQGNQSVGFWCNWGYMNDLQYVTVKTQEIRLRTFDFEYYSQYDSPPSAHYEVDYQSCRWATDFAMMLPWNQERCQKQVVWQSLEIPLAWVTK